MKQGDKWLHVENAVFIVCFCIVVLVVYCGSNAAEWIKWAKEPCVVATTVPSPTPTPTPK